MIESPVLLVGGLSGAGKSTVSAWIAEDLAMLHYEIDMAGVDGIDRHNLRHEWNEFYRRCNGAPLASVLRTRSAYAGKRGVIVSFPSNAVFKHEHIGAANAAGVQVMVLVGAVDHCLNGFLERERSAGRGFDEERWHRFNDGAVALYGGAAYDSIRVEAFHPDGSRGTRKEIVELIRRRFVG